MKLLLCMMIIASSLLIGLYFSSRLSGRAKILGEYINLLENVSVKMTYTSACLAELFSDNFAAYRFDEKRPFESQFNEMTQRCHRFLKQEDIRILDDLSHDLGIGDTASQLKRLRLCIRLLEVQRDAAVDEEQRKGKIYRVLPLSIGVAAAILLI